MKIIEFYGLPGSGKSSVVVRLIQKLSSENIVCINLSEIFSLYQSNKLRKLMLSIVSLLMQPKLFYLFSKLRSFNLADMPLVIYSLRLFYFHRTRFFKSKAAGADFVIADQYLLQAIASLYVSSKNKNQDFGFFISEINEIVNVFVFNDCAIELSLSRVRKRNDRKSRFDFWSDEIAIQKLEEMDSILRMLDNEVESFKIDGGVCLDDNIDIMSNYCLQDNFESD